MFNWLRLNDVSLDLDDPDTTDQYHRKIIRNKKLLREFYNSAYTFFDEQTPDVPGEILELGSGGGYLKEWMPGVITSDILELKNIDRVVSAEDLPFPDGGLRAILMLDVFHHLPDVPRFLSEASRCLAEEGRIIMLEPANTAWSRFIYSHFHHEPFNPEQKEWNLPEGGPMSMANGALPWIVFQRDRKFFESRFPEFRIISQNYIHPILYLLSGGVSMKQLVPDFMAPIIRAIERLAIPLNPYTGMFTQLVVEKRNSTEDQGDRLLAAS